MVSNDKSKPQQKQNKKQEEEIINFGVIGKYENKNIFFNEGSKFGDYLTHDKKNYSIPECFKPLTISKAIKIISFKKNNKKYKEETETNIEEPE